MVADILPETIDARRVKADLRLTSRGLLQLELFPPPPALAPHVTSFFAMRSEERAIRDVQASSLGILAVMARGGGRMRFLDGRSDPSWPLTLMSPTGAASTFEVKGPWHVFGCALTPLGWAGLTGLSAAAHGNRLYDGAALLGPAFAEMAEAITQGFDTLTPDEKLALYQRAILGAVRPLPAGHVRFVEITAEWLRGSLSPDIATLTARVGYSERQIQRLADRYFGLPPSALARKYRALRAAALLSRPDITADEIAAVQDHFYDQPHMIREMRLFAGRTPARIGDPDMPYHSALLDLRNFRAIGPRLAPIPDDLRA